MNVQRIIRSATPFSKAIYHKDELLAANLLDRGANVNLQKRRECATPLLLAIDQFLLDKGARTDLKADGKMALSPLDLAHIGRIESFAVFPQHRVWSEEEVDKLFERWRDRRSSWVFFLELCLQLFRKHLRQ